MPSKSAPQSSRKRATHNVTNIVPIAPPQMRKIRKAVLHLVSELEVEAEAREAVDLAIQTHRAGWRPVIASAGGALVLEAERAAVRHMRMPLNRHNLFSRWRSRVQLEALVQRERPSIIHAHGYNALIAARGISASHRLPLLIDLVEPLPVTPAHRKRLQQAATRGARFRVPSEYMMKHLRDDFQLETQYLYHILPGVDLQWFDAVRVSPERLQNLSSLWRLPEHGIVILMATPLAPGYGHRNLLEALAALKRKDVFVLLVGSDRAAPGMRAEIEAVVLACGLEGKVVMPESCPDWPAACWLSSLIVATNNLPRGQAMELLAAQAIGRPVIVTDCGANNEMVHSGETAWVIPVNDKKKLMQALNEAIPMSVVQRIDLAVRTRDFVAMMFPQTVWREAMFELYDAMLEQPMDRLLAQQAS